MGITAGEVLGVKAMTTAGQTVRLPVMLMDSTGAPVTGVLFNAAGVTVAWAKEGDSSFTPFTMATENWDEIGYGNYDIVLRFGEALETAWLAAEGHLRVYIKFTATRGDTFLFKVNVADAARDDQWTDTKAGYLDASVASSVSGLAGTLATAHGAGSWLTATGFSTVTTAEVLAQVNAALNAAIPGTPTADSINERIKAIDDLLQAAGAGDAAATKAAAAKVAALVETSGGHDRYTAAALETAPVTSTVGLATTTDISTLQTHGDSAWKTATGFATSAALSTLAGVFAGITSLAAWLRGLARSDAMNAAAKTELNASGGTYDEASDSLEALATSVSTGAGAFPITLYVRDGASVPIQNAKVRINATGGTVVATTTSLGAVTFNVDAGTYTAYVGTAASYTPAASYTVVVSGAGAVTSPTGGILTVTAVALPTPTDPGAYALYNRETDEQGSAFGAAGMTVTVTGLSYAGRVDAASNLSRSVMGRSATTDASGDWSLDIPQHCFSDGACLTVTKAWTTAGGVAKTETWSADLVAPTGGATQVCWSDLAPYTSS